MRASQALVEGAWVFLTGQVGHLEVACFEAEGLQAQDRARVQRELAAAQADAA